MEPTIDEAVRDAWLELYQALVRYAVTRIGELFAHEQEGDVAKALVSVVGPGMRAEVTRMIPVREYGGIMPRSELVAQVKHEWNTLIDTLTKEAVLTIYQQFSHEDPIVLEDALLRVVKPSMLVRIAKHMPKTTVVYPVGSELAGCSNANAQGFVIDPITQNRVEGRNIVSYTVEGRKYCFDLETLYEYVMKNSNPINPLTREPLPRQFVDNVIARATVPFVSVLGDRKLTYPSFTVYGELIVTVHRSTGNILASLAENDVLADGVSLFTYPLLDRVMDGMKELALVSFSGTKERDDKLLLMFRYANKMSDQLSQSMKSFLGALLRLVPVYSDRDVNIPADSTIMDAIVYALREHGYENWNVMDVVLSNGTSLYSLNLNSLVTETLPGETIYTVLGQFDRDALLNIRGKLLKYIHEFGNVGLKDAILADIRRLIDRIVSGEDVRREVDDLRLVFDPRLFSEGDRIGMIGRVINALISGVTGGRTKILLWEFLVGETPNSIPILVDVPFVDMGARRKWQKYLDHILEYMSPGIMKRAVRYVKNFVPNEGGHMPKINLRVVAALDSPELVRDLHSSGLIDYDDVSTVVLLSMDRSRNSLIRQEFSLPPTVSVEGYPSLADVVIESTDNVGDLVSKVLQKIGYDSAGNIGIVHVNPLVPGNRLSLPSIDSSVMDICNHVVTVVDRRLMGDSGEKEWVDLVNGVALERNIVPLITALGLRSIPSILEQVPLTLTYDECVPIIRSLSWTALLEFGKNVTRALLLSATPKTVPLLKLLWDRNAKLAESIRETINRIPLKDIAVNLDWVWYMEVRRPIGSRLPKPNRTSVNLIVWYLRDTVTPPKYISSIEVANTMSEELAQAMLDGGYISQSTYGKSIKLIRGEDR